MDEVLYINNLMEDASSSLSRAQKDINRLIEALKNAQAENAALKTRIWRIEKDDLIRMQSLEDALKKARHILYDIDEYQKRPERGDWGVECACCMGELLDDDRKDLAFIDSVIKECEDAKQR